MKKSLFFSVLFLLLGISITTSAFSIGTAPDIDWQKCFGGTGFDSAYSIQQTSDGGYIVIGDTNSINGNVTGNHGSSDYWVVKLTEAGDISWQKCLGGSSLDEAFEIRQTSDSGYIVTGLSQSNNGNVTGNHGNFDYWVVKLNETGDINWQRLHSARI